MSFTHTIPDRSARPIGELLGRLGRKIKGDADRPTDPVHRDSYDVDDPRAQPWRDKPFQKDVARADETAVLAAFDVMMLEEALALTKARAAMSAARREGREPTPEERPMPPEDRLHADYRRVLARYLEQHIFTKGRAFESIQTTADALGMPPSRVKQARRCLQMRGLLDWRRRSKKVPNMDGRPGWHRRQTSCAYHFLNVAQRLVGKARRVYLETRTRLLRKRGATPEAVRPAAPTGGKDWPDDPGLSALLLRVGQGLVARDAALGSASP